MFNMVANVGKIVSIDKINDKEVILTIEVKDNIKDEIFTHTQWTLTKALSEPLEKYGAKKGDIVGLKGVVKFGINGAELIAEKLTFVGSRDKENE